MNVKLVQSNLTLVRTWTNMDNNYAPHTMHEDTYGKDIEHREATKA